MVETTTYTTSPSASLDSDPALAGESEFAGQGREAILIVDDDAAVAYSFARYLRRRFDCSTAASAIEALDLLARESYSLVITDVMMPGRNGIELLREIRFRYPETAVIIVSGIDRSQRVLDALRIGAFDYLIKPCELDVLMISVERALERRTLQRTAQKYKADLEKQNTELAERSALLQRLQAQLVHSEKMAGIGQLVAGIAHELNNPAGFICGNMGLLKDRLADVQELLRVYDTAPLPPDLGLLVGGIKERISYDKLAADLESMLADCLEGAVRINDVVQNLRLFSRLDEAELKQVDLHDGIDSTIRLLSRYYSSGRIELRRDYGVLPLVSCYASQLNQVWMNLLANAAQSIPARGTVTISTRRVGESVEIAISDNGCGISADQLSRIFDPFFTTKPVGEGTGLGLSISYGIVERHGGTISVESAVNCGTTFTIRIGVDATRHIL